MGSEVETVTDDPATRLRRDQEPSEPTVQPVSTTGSADREAAHTGFPLAEDRRDRLLERLAEGARNAELVAEFGISPKKFRGSVWVATGRLPNGAQGSRTNLLDPQPSINPPTRPLRSTRSFVTCGNRTILSSRRKMAGIWSMGASECQSQNWPPVRTGYGAGSKNQLSKYPWQACNSGPVLGKKAIPFFGRPHCPSVVSMGSANQPIMTLKARSSSVEHCPHTAEVGGSIPSHAYQICGNRLEWLTGRAARGLGAACDPCSVQHNVSADRGILRSAPILLSQSGRALPCFVLLLSGRL